MSVLYGIHAVEEALRADPERIERIFIERGQKNPRITGIVEVCRRKHVQISFQERTWLDRRLSGLRHQGVVCCVAEIPAFEAEEIVEQAMIPALVLILDGIEDPQNVGAILRSAEAAGVDGVFVPRRRSAGLSAAVVRASAGAASHVRVSRISNVAQLIGLLKKHGYWVAGLDAASGQPVWEADLTVPIALILGNEGSGLHKLVKEKCDFLVSLPIEGKVGAYNVSVAAGIALYEALRQRKLKGLGVRRTGN